jgi:hypothetical protein
MEMPTRDTNHSLLKLTTVNGLTPQQASRAEPCCDVLSVEGTCGLVPRRV